MSIANESVERRQYLSFTMAGGGYGVGILTVKEILQFSEVTRVPSTPRSIRGVINLRGSVVPVVDLAVKLGMPETVPTARTCILVVEASLGGTPAVVGLLVDSVSEVVDLAPEEVEPPPSFGTNVRMDHLLGMGKVGRRFVLLLDIDRIVSAEEIELTTALSDAAAAGDAQPAPAATGTRGQVPAEPTQP